MPYFKGDFFDVDCIASKVNFWIFQSEKEITKINFFFFSTGQLTVENNELKKL